MCEKGQKKRVEERERVSERKKRVRQRERETDGDKKKNKKKKKKKREKRITGGHAAMKKTVERKKYPTKPKQPHDHVTCSTTSIG